jgi:hypothetical protein
MSNITLTAAGPAQTTTDSTATVTVTPAPAAGTSLRFSLTVTDDLGNTSQPSFVIVTVQALPVAVVTGPKAVPAGQTINLVGTASTPTGHITKYTWQLVPVT